jgi:hypothetical protein
VGDDADTSTLERLARQGGGAYFYAMNPQNLPRIFLKAVRVVRSPLIREGDFGPVVLPSGSAMVALASSADHAAALGRHYRDLGTAAGPVRIFVVASTE